jgi:acetyltransferase-like isoleucine patch superfamily enzyme
MKLNYRRNYTMPASKQLILEKIYHFFNRVRGKAFTFAFSPCFYSIGSNCAIMPPFRFYNLKEVKIGDNVVIHPDCWIQGLDIAISNNYPKLIIGNGSSVGMHTIISAAHSIIIGNDVLIAPHVYISDYGHEYNDISIPISRQGIRKVKEIKIDDGTWIGYNAILLPGAQIGRNCVIGAHSVVNSKIPDNCVAVGNPARIFSSYNKEKKTWVKENLAINDK